MTENTSQPAAEFKADFNDLNYFKNIYHQNIQNRPSERQKISQSDGAFTAVVEKPCSAPSL